MRRLRNSTSELLSSFLRIIYTFKNYIFIIIYLYANKTLSKASNYIKLQLLSYLKSKGSDMEIIEIADNLFTQGLNYCRIKCIIINKLIYNILKIPSYFNNNVCINFK